MKWIIYRATNRINGGLYIGVTKCGLRRRRHGHLQVARDKKSRSYFHAAIRKYGPQSFEWDVIAKCDTETIALAAERAFIALLSPRYNRTAGGDYRHMSFEERSALHRDRAPESYLQRRGAKPRIERSIILAAPLPAYVEKEEEEWRAVVGYDGYYEVSDHGHIRSCDRLVGHYAAKGGKMFRHGRPMKLRPMADGRLFVNLNREGRKPWTASVAILVAEAFIRPRQKGERVLRRDGDPLNDLASNLFWGDAKEWTANRGRHGRTARGEHHHEAKIKDADVLTIRDLRGKDPQRITAARFGVTQPMISAIQLGKVHTDVIVVEMP